MKGTKHGMTQEKVMEKALVVLLIFQMGLIAISNLILISRNLDCDSANLLHHIITMAKEKTILIEGWSYITTLEWDCTALFALPFYFLTHNIYISCTLSNTVFLFIMIAVLFLVFQGEKRLYPLLCANIIFIPYQVGQLDYYNMLFFSGAQYIVKVLIPLLLIGIILSIDRSAYKKSVLLGSIAAYFILLMISSISSNMYVAVCGVAPVCIVYVGYKFFRWEKISVKAIALMAGSVVCALIGMAANNKIMGTSKATGMVLCSRQALLDNMTSCFFGLFELMGGSTSYQEVAVLSPRGILQLMKICLLAVILCCGVIALVKCIKKQGNLRLLLLLSVFIWNYFILNVTDVRYGAPTYEYRYHLIGLLPLIGAAVLVLWQGLDKLRGSQRSVIFAGVILALAALTAGSFRELWQREDPNAQLKEIVKYCENVDVEMIYMFHDSSASEVCRLLDDKHLYLELLGGGTTCAYDYYGSYHGAAMQTESVIVVVDDAVFDLGESFLVEDKVLVKFDNVGGRSLYYFYGE